MAIGYIIGGGGGGVTSSEVTAKKENVLEGKTTVTSDSDDAVVNGTMPNIGKVTQTLGVNGSYTIPRGFHDGTGTVSQNLVTKGAATYYATTSDQTIAANQYLTGAQVIKKLTQSGLTSGNILRGKTITINNGNANVWSVTGSTNVLKTSVVQVSSGLSRAGFQLRDYSSQAVSTYYMYYADINPGMTPALALCLAGEMFFWREPNAYFNMIANDGATGGIFAMTGFFVNASDAPFTASTLRVFFPSSSGGYVRIFGY